MSGRGKIFLVGLPKTGTSSLVKALELLGYSALGDTLSPDLIRCLSMRGVIPKTVYAKYDVFWDAAICAYWRELSEAYPEAKWIVTQRGNGGDGPSPWTESFASTQGVDDKDLSVSGWPQDAAKKILLHIDKGVPLEMPLIRYYIAHMDEVVDGLRGHDVMLMNIPYDPGPTSWKKLLDFLDVPFPHENKRGGS